MKFDRRLNLERDLEQEHEVLHVHLEHELVTRPWTMAWHLTFNIVTWALDLNHLFATWTLNKF